MLVDLHMHSTFSDGVLTPAELIAEVKLAQIEVFAITDHDSVNGYNEAKRLLQGTSASPKIIAGVELGSQLESNSIHILGYYIDPDYQPLLERMKELRHGREQRLQKILAKLKALDYNITVAMVDAQNRAVGRPHVAKALVAKGYFCDVQAAFDALLARGKPGYVPQPKLSPLEGVSLIHAAGGIAFLAHPQEIGDNEVVEGLLKEVPFDGIEVYHPSADAAAREYLLALSQKYKLMVSGGSDFHGNSGRFPEQIGIFKVFSQNVKSMIEYK